MNMRSLRDFIPVMPIASPDDDCIASVRGDVTFGWRLALPVAYTVNEGGYDSILQTFLQAYRLLPEYTIVHKQDVYCYDTYRGGREREFLMDSFERFHDGMRFLNGHSFLYLTFSCRANVESGSGGGSLSGIFKPRIPDAAFISRCADVASQFGSVLANNSLLRVEPLKASDFLYVGEGGRDEGTLADYLRFYMPDGPDYDFEFFPSYMRYGDVVAKAWYVEDSDAYPNVVSSARPVMSMSAGMSAVFLSGGAPFGFQLRIPHVVNRYIVTLPRRAVEAELTQKRRLMTSFSGYSASCRVNAEELQAYLDEGARNGDMTVKCFTDVIAWGRPSDMDGVRNAVVTAFSDLEMRVTEERRLMPSLFYAGIPGAASELGSDYLMTSELNAFLCHGLWDGYDGGIPGGVIRLCDRRRMMPLRVDAQRAAMDMGLVTNLNMLVVGPSGSGKSFTMNHIVNNLYVAGQHGLIIDIGDSYEGLCAVIREQTGGRDGVYRSYDPRHPLSFNPFHGYRQWWNTDEEGNYESSGYDYFISLLQTMYEPAGGWNSANGGTLSAVVRHFLRLWDHGWDDAFSTLLADCRAVCAREQKVSGRHKDREEEPAADAASPAGVLDPLPGIFRRAGEGAEPVFDEFYRYMAFVAAPLLECGELPMDSEGQVKTDDRGFFAAEFCKAAFDFSRQGKYGFLLNAEEETDMFSSALTCYEVDLIKDKKDLFPLWMLSIMHSFVEKMRRLECPKYMVIEEAWSAMAKPTMASFITWLWRTARKFRTSAIVVTQSAADLVTSPIIKDAIIQNTSTRILLEQTDINRFGETAEVLGLTPMDISLIMSINKNRNAGHRYKEVFMAVGSRYSNVFAVEVSPEQALAYETEKVKKAPLLRLAGQRGSFIAAIRETVEAARGESEEQKRK